MLFFLPFFLDQLKLLMMSQIEEGGPPSIFMSMTLTFLQGLHDLKIETSGKGRLFAFKICEPRQKWFFSTNRICRPTLGGETAALKPPSISLKEQS